MRDPEFAKRPIYISTDAPLTSSLAREATRAGATRIFNCKSTPLENIIAEITADLNFSQFDYAV